MQLGLPQRRLLLKLLGLESERSLVVDSKIVHGKHGEPFVELSEDGMKLMKSFGGNKILVSLTHLSTIASAIIIITD